MEKTYRYNENNYLEGILWQQFFRFCAAVNFFTFLFGHLFSEDDFYMFSCVIFGAFIMFCYFSFNINSRKSINQNYQFNLTDRSFFFSDKISVFCKMWQRHISMPTIFNLPIDEVTKTEIIPHKEKNFPNYTIPRPKSYICLKSPFWYLEFDNNIEDSDSLLSEIDNKVSLRASTVPFSSDEKVFDINKKFLVSQALYTFQRRYMYGAISVFALALVAFYLQVFFFDTATVFEVKSDDPDSFAFYYFSVLGAFVGIFAGLYIYLRGLLRLSALNQLELNIEGDQFFFTNTENKRVRKYFPMQRFDLNTLEKVGYVAIIKTIDDEQNEFIPEYFELTFSGDQKIKFYNAFENDKELFALLVEWARQNYLRDNKVM